MTPTSSVRILGRSLRMLFQRWPVLLTVQGISFLLVLPVVLAFRATLANAFGTSPVLERMFLEFDHTTYADFMLGQQEAISFFRRTIGPLMLVSIIVHGMLGAGLAVSMAGEGTISEFLKATGRFLGRSFRLLLYAVLLGGSVMALWMIAVGILWSAMTSGNAVESDYLLALIVSGLLVLVPVAIISLSAEYGRILLVRGDRSKVFRALVDGFTFVVKHPLRMLVQHGFIVLNMLLLVVCYWIVEDVVGMTSVAGVLVMLFVQQSSVFGRIAMRGWHTSSGVALVDVLTPEVTPESVIIPVIPASMSAQSTASLPFEPVMSAPAPARIRRAPRSGARRPAPGRRGTARKGPKKR